MSEKALRIELLGHARLVREDAGPVSLPSGRPLALLGYLVLHRDAPVRRERLASLLWPDSKEGQARTNLRRELHRLRRELPRADALLAVGAETLQWRTDGPATVDVEAFERRVRRSVEARAAEDVGAELAALKGAVVLYRGDLLPSVDGDWVESERARLRAALVSGLARLVELHEARGDLGAALACAERVVRLEPLDEAAYRALMRLNQRSGSRAAAVHAFHRLAGVLDREVDAVPSETTRQAYEELMRSSGDVAAPDPTDARDAVRLVGRDGALARLREAWLEAGAVGPRAAVVYGEAGIGKTRLVEEFVRRVQGQAGTVAAARAYGADGPVSYGLAFDWLRVPAVAEGIADLPRAWRGELARLAPELGAHDASARHAPDGMPATWRRRRLLEAIARGLLAAPQPLLLIADDLQWADGDSLDVLRLVTRLEMAARVLVVATVRSEELSGNARLEQALLSLRYGSRLHELELGRLGMEQTALLAREVAGKDLEPDRLERIHRVSEGVPLFVVEALRADAAMPGQRGDEAGDVPAALTPRVRAVLSARLRQLTPGARELAELAATIGRAFSFEVLKRATDQSEEALVRSLDELWRRRLVREQAASTYDFSHDALRDAAYREAEPARRRLLHRRVATVLESLPGEGAGAPNARVAHHYEQGGEVDRAVEAYGRAAREASALFSHEEAVRLLDRAQALLAGEPAGVERDRRELELHLARVVPLRLLGGHAAPALEAAMRRVQELSERVGDRAGLFQALISQQVTHLVSGRVGEALELSGPLQTLSQEVPDWRAEVEHAMGGTHLNAGDLEGAIAHFERSVACFDPEAGAARLSMAGADLAVFTAAWQAHALWLYGLPDRALASSARAVRRAESLDDRYSEVVAHAYTAVLHHMRRDRVACLRHAGAARDLCQRHGFAYYVHWGRLLAAWADVARDPEDRVEPIREAIASLEGEGAATRKPFYLSVLAIALAEAGERPAARATLDEASVLAAASDEAWWRPEIARLRALLVPDRAGAVEGLREALGCALAMKARPLAERAAVSLALALRSIGRTDEAQRALGHVLGGSPQRGNDRDHMRARLVAARLGG